MMFQEIDVNRLQHTHCLVHKTILFFLLLQLQFTSANAVNWLMLQGTEPAKVTHRSFLFLQPSYTRDLCRQINAGPNTGNRAVASTIAPRFDDNSRFHFRRARAGVRGNFTGILKNSFTEKMNYFFLAEFAPNLLTYDFSGERENVAGLDHLSITANHFTGARLRFGLFKTLGLEEIYQGIVAQDY